MKIGSREFDTQNGFYIMGILNVTPDSFSDGGRYNNFDAALMQAERMINEGADILDIGGESTRPGHEEVSIEQEIQRVAPVIEAIKERFDVPVSIDSYKPPVIRAVASKVDLINDVWGLRRYEEMAPFIAELGLPCCLMHNREKADYKDFWPEFIGDLKETLATAEKAGINKNKIILDGGVGFGKSYENNLTVMKNTSGLVELGYPVMIATSRKSVIGLTLDKPSDERIFGTVTTTIMGVIGGASFVRVHDVGENRDAIRMAKSIIEEKKWIV